MTYKLSWGYMREGAFGVLVRERLLAWLCVSATRGAERHGDYE